MIILLLSNYEICKNGSLQKVDRIQAKHMQRNINMLKSVCKLLQIFSFIHKFDCAVVVVVVVVAAVVAVVVYDFIKLYN